jgi:hypothetical protein
MPRVFKYQIGEQVRVIQLDDDSTHRGLVGHVGVIVDRIGDAFPQPLNYEIKCVTCGATHFMHETELIAVGATSPGHVGHQAAERRNLNPERNAKCKTPQQP